MVELEARIEIGMADGCPGNSGGTYLPDTFQTYKKMQGTHWTKMFQKVLRSNLTDMGFADISNKLFMWFILEGSGRLSTPTRIVPKYHMKSHLTPLVAHVLSPPDPPSRRGSPKI